MFNLLQTLKNTSLDFKSINFSDKNKCKLDLQVVRKFYVIRVKFHRKHFMFNVCIVVTENFFSLILSFSASVSVTFSLCLSVSLSLARSRSLSISLYLSISLPLAIYLSLSPVSIYLYFSNTTTRILSLPPPPSSHSIFNSLDAKVVAS